MNQPILLDLFCCGGGASMGYSRAGFNVVGVDIKPQPRYPFEFICDNALDYLEKHWREYDAFHASPPCQRWSTITKSAGTSEKWPDLLSPIRDLLKATGKPYIIENVPGSPINADLLLCGTMFGLRFQRHRLFECNPTIGFSPASCCHNRRVAEHGRSAKANEMLAFTGHFSGVKEVQAETGMYWLGQNELREAVPPIYTEYTGKYLLRAISI